MQKSSESECKHEWIVGAWKYDETLKKSVIVTNCIHCGTDIVISEFKGYSKWGYPEAMAAFRKNNK